MTDMEYMLSCIGKIYESDRFFSYDSMKKSCSIVEGLMRELGMEQVTTDFFPSDGVTDFGGWLMPLCWNPRHAVLNVVLPDGSEQQICSYEEVPCSLMLYSREADVTAEIAPPDAADVSGKIIFSEDRLISMPETLALMKRGALGIVCACLRSPWLGKKGFEYLDDASQWCNYQIPFWQVKEKPFGFSLSRNQGKFLRDLLKKNGKVTLHAKLDIEMTEGSIPVVSGLLPGETSEEIVLNGHLFEEGANDNASGVAEALAIVRNLASQPRKRGIRLMFTHECKSQQAYLNSKKQIPNMVAGLNIDMVGAFQEKKAIIGDSAPSYPTYATPFFKFILEKYGCTVAMVQISGNDSSFCEPATGTAILSEDFMEYPNYHNSMDTLDKMDPDCLNLTFSAAKDYVEYLVNAGLKEAKMLAESCRAYDMERKTPGRIANQRLRSVANLVDNPADRRELDSFLQTLQFAEEPCLVTVQSESLRKIFPKKQFRGFFSFEKFWCHEEEQYPELAGMFSGWSGPAWLDHALIWADGTRSAEEILNLVNAYCKRTVAPDLFEKLLLFLKQHGYISIEEK